MITVRAVRTLESGAKRQEIKGRLIAAKSSAQLPQVMRLSHPFRPPSRLALGKGPVSAPAGRGALWEPCRKSRSPARTAMRIPTQMRCAMQPLRRDEIPSRSQRRANPLQGHQPPPSLPKTAQPTTLHARGAGRSLVLQSKRRPHGACPRSSSYSSLLQPSGSK
jgi:hypothetical protein